MRHLALVLVLLAALMASPVAAWESPDGTVGVGCAPLPGQPLRICASGGADMTVVIRHEGNATAGLTMSTPNASYTQGISLVGALTPGFSLRDDMLMWVALHVYQGRIGFGTSLPYPTTDFTFLGSIRQDVDVYGDEQDALWTTRVVITDSIHSDRYYSIESLGMGAVGYRAANWDSDYIWGVSLPGQPLGWSLADVRCSPRMGETGGTGGCGLLRLHVAPDGRVTLPAGLLTVGVTDILAELQTLATRLDALETR